MVMQKGFKFFDEKFFDKKASTYLQLSGDADYINLYFEIAEERSASLILRINIAKLFRTA